jgi:hypothetical protein
MSHFAQIESTNIENIFTVTAVLVIEQIDIDTGVFGDPSTFVQTSYNTKGGIHYDPNTRQPDGGIALRANYASIGDTYDKVNDVFYSPRPFDINGVLCESWTIGAPTWTWMPPVTKPPFDPNTSYNWNETTKTWIASPRKIKSTT